MPGRSSLLRGRFERSQPLLHSGPQLGAVVKQHQQRPGHRLLGADAGRSVVGSFQHMPVHGLAPVEIPVQVSSRPGSTTANLDLMRALPLTQVNQASAATVDSRWTSWTARSHVPKAGTLTSSSQTFPTGASMRISRAAPTGALASMRPFFAYSSCNTSIEGPR